MTENVMKTSKESPCFLKHWKLKKMSKIELFAKIGNGFRAFVNCFRKSSILDVFLPLQVPYEGPRMNEVTIFNPFRPSSLIYFSAF